MKTQATRVRAQVLAIVVVVVAGLGVIIWQRMRHPGFGNDHLDFRQPNLTVPLAEPSSQPSPAPTASSAPGHTQVPSPGGTPNNDGFEVATPSPAKGRANGEMLAGNYVGTLKLIIPVVGVNPDQLLDTFADARSEGRVHDAIDIPAAAGTPVVAAIDGEIIKLFQSERGGTTIYQLSPDKKLIFYYAHLQRYAEGLVAGKHVRQGEVIAYVGDTGNAGAGNYHLHFSIAVVADPTRYWEGTNINPYPLLRK